MFRKRVLFLITDLKIGGAPLVVKQLATGLDRHRFDVRVACLSRNGPVADDIRQAGINVHCLDAAGPWDIRVFFRLARLIRDFRPHIIQSALVHANIAARLVGTLLGVPHILAALHTIEKGKRWHLKLENLTCRLSRKTICIGESVRRHLANEAHVPGNRLMVIPNGIDVDRFEQATPMKPAELGLDPNRKTLLYLGRVDPVKGIDLIFYAMAALISAFDLQLVIAGDGPEKQKLKMLSDRFKLTDRIHYLGFRRDTPRLIKSADMLILSSYWEGMPLCLLEAMAGGTAVIASDTAGSSEIIQDHKTGVLFPVGSMDGLAGAIRKLLENPEFAQKISSAASQYVKDHYSHLNMIQGYSHIFMNV